MLLAFGGGLGSASGALPNRGVATHRPTLRYVFNSGDSQAAAAAAGWNLLDVSSKEEADALPRRTRGLMWLGDYDNSGCAWERSDSELAQPVRFTRRFAASRPT